MTREELIAAIGKSEADRARLLAQLLAHELQRESDDRLLTVTEAAGILSVTNDWLYRNADKFTFTIRPGPGQVRFSKNGIQEYLRRKRR